MNRRELIKAGTAIVTLPSFMGANFPLKKTKLANERSVVFVMLRGGHSHYELHHANPNLFGPYVSVNGLTQSKTPGLWFGGDYQELAKISDKFNTVQSYHHKNGNHANAVFWGMSGRESNRTDQTEPAYGSYVSKFYGPSSKINGLPVYLKNTTIDGENGAWLGSAFNPYEASDKGTADLVLKIEPERFAQRLRILEAVENQFGNRHEQLKSLNGLKEQAVGMIVGNLKEVFEVKHESEKVREAYGKNVMGDSFLLARRLLEAGGRFINLGIGSWDMHSGISNAMKQQGPILDKALTTFINDLSNRGMLQNTMVVITTDFGRTKINQNGGRDHFSGIVPLIIAGGITEQGRVIGKCNKTATEVEDKEFYPKDVAKTIFDHLGLNNVEITDNAGRPRWIYDTDAKNILL